MKRMARLAQSQRQVKILSRSFLRWVLLALILGLHDDDDDDDDFYHLGWWRVGGGGPHLAITGAAAETSPRPLRAPTAREAPDPSSPLPHWAASWTASQVQRTVVALVVPLPRSTRTGQATTGDLEEDTAAAAATDPSCPRPQDDLGCTQHHRQQPPHRQHRPHRPQQVVVVVVVVAQPTTTPGPFPRTASSTSSDWSASSLLGPARARFPSWNTPPWTPPILPEGSEVIPSSTTTSRAPQAEFSTGKPKEAPTPNNDMDDLGLKLLRVWTYDQAHDSVLLEDDHEGDDPQPQQEGEYDAKTDRDAFLYSPSRTDTAPTSWSLSSSISSQEAMSWLGPQTLTWWTGFAPDVDLARRQLQRLALQQDFIYNDDHHDHQAPASFIISSRTRSDLGSVAGDPYLAAPQRTHLMVRALSQLLSEATLWRGAGRPLGLQALTIGYHPTRAAGTHHRHHQYPDGSYTSKRLLPPAWDLYTHDPSGGFRHWGTATAIGRNAAAVRKRLHQLLSSKSSNRLKSDLSESSANHSGTLSAALELVLEALRSPSSMQDNQATEIVSTKAAAQYRYEAWLIWMQQDDVAESEKDRVDELGYQDSAMLAGLIHPEELEAAWKRIGLRHQRQQQRKVPGA